MTNKVDAVSLKRSNPYEKYLSFQALKKLLEGKGQFTPGKGATVGHVPYNPTAIDVGNYNPPKNA